ncbi:MAG TPA: histidine phosphatase family protein [Pseudolysinimonas sp.]|nr:histidine phosphatase family protein [Pseudolysinimonas sp.]
MTELFLVRHGETDWNRQRRIQGVTDIPLNETGREQARRTGELLARRSWDAVYTSPLDRAHESARIISSQLGLSLPTVVPELSERNYGEAEGMVFTEIEARYPDRDSVPGQETRAEVVARVLPALTALAAAHPGESLVVVSHGGAIRALLNEAEPEASHGMITNGSIHSFRMDDDTLRLIAFDDPIELDSRAAATGDDLDEQNAVEAAS